VGKKGGGVAAWSGQDEDLPVESEMAVGGSSETGVEVPEGEAEAAEMLRLAMPTASRGKLCSRDLRRRSTKKEKNRSMRWTCRGEMLRKVI